MVKAILDQQYAPRGSYMLHQQMSSHKAVSHALQPGVGVNGKYHAVNIAFDPCRCKAHEKV